MRALALLFLLSEQPPARPVWTAPGANFVGAPTRDGRFLSCVDPSSGDLALLNLSTGKLTRLTSNPPGSREFAYFSAPSPNARHIAYAWFNDAGFYDLRLVSADGGPPRVLFRNEESGFVQPTSWTPDGVHILTLFFRKDNISQIALVDAASGAVRILKSLNWVYPKKMDVSPDGKWIVYDSFAGDKPGPRDLYLLAADGSSERKLTETPSEEVFPFFSPGGQEVVFARSEAGATSIHAFELSSGRERLLYKDAGRVLPLGLTREGALIYGLRTGASDIRFSGLGALETRTPGLNLAPAWSRDGAKLAYLSLRGAENFGTPSRVIVLRDLALRTERDLETRMAHVESLRWSPDGESLLASGSDGLGRRGIFRIRVKDGFTRPVATEENAGFRGIPGDWNQAGEPVRAPSGATAFAIGPQAATANEIEVKSGERTWPLAAVRWLVWAGDRLFASHDGKAVELTAEGIKPVPLPDYDGGPFSVSPDGKTFVYAAGRVRNEVWIRERLLAPLDRAR